MTQHDTCGVCSFEGETETITIQEKMFGFGDRFDYFRCPNCGCLQIRDTSVDAARYYPQNYYSFNLSQPQSAWMARLERARDAYAVRRQGMLGRALLRIKPHAPLESLHGLGLQRTTRILDVGCGSGDLLQALHRLGYTDLTGVDPNIAADIVFDGGLRIHKRLLQDLDGSYDVVMFHHSLEHIPDQLGALQAAARRLAPQGQCLVRIPLVGHHAWKAYGLNWAQLDAPRHLFLHTEKSLALLAARAGFEVASTTFDSNEFQFWGSECLQRGLPLVDIGSGKPNPMATAIQRAGSAGWRRQARQLNARTDGDQAAFVLRRSARAGAAAA